MDYVNETLAVGIMIMNKEGYDEMMVLHGVIRECDHTYFFDSPGEAPFEMSKAWLEKIKPVEPSLGPEFQGSKYCLVIASLQKPKG